MAISFRLFFFWSNRWNNLPFWRSQEFAVPTYSMEAFSVFPQPWGPQNRMRIIIIESKLGSSIPDPLKFRLCFHGSDSRFWWVVSRISWLVGGLEHFLFSHILKIVIPFDFHIFQMGGSTTNQLGVVISPEVTLSWTEACALGWSTWRNDHLRRGDDWLSPWAKIWSEEKVRRYPLENWMENLWR